MTPANTSVERGLKEIDFFPKRSVDARLTLTLDTNRKGVGSL